MSMSSSFSFSLLLSLLSFSLLFSLSSSSSSSLPSSLSSSNRIVEENLKEGNLVTEWDISGSGDPSIQGYATSMRYTKHTHTHTSFLWSLLLSLFLSSFFLIASSHFPKLFSLTHSFPSFSFNVGDSLEIKVLTDSVAYRVDIYRVGYYSGHGARKVDRSEWEREKERMRERERKGEWEREREMLMAIWMCILWQRFAVCVSAAASATMLHWRGDTERRKEREGKRERKRERKSERKRERWRENACELGVCLFCVECVPLDVTDDVAGYTPVRLREMGRFRKMGHSPWRRVWNLLRSFSARGQPDSIHMEKWFAEDFHGCGGVTFELNSPLFSLKYLWTFSLI